MTNDESSTSISSDELLSSHSFTFNQPARAYVEYRYTWQSSDESLQSTIRFSFRSARPSGLLLYFGLFEDGSDTAPQVWARLRRGSMHVTLTSSSSLTSSSAGQLASEAQTIILGRGNCVFT